MDEHAPASELDAQAAIPGLLRDTYTAAASPATAPNINPPILMASLPPSGIVATYIFSLITGSILHKLRKAKTGIGTACYGNMVLDCPTIDNKAGKTMTKATMNTICAVFALTALLTSCSSPSKTTAGSVNALPSASSAAAQSPSSQQTSPAPETPTLSATPAAEPSPSPKVKAPLYKMTTVYRLVPIDETKTSKKAVLLTFDDAPHNEEVINSLLDTLDKHKAKAIFFVNGYRVKQHPELLKLINDRGQTIGNHSWDHIDLKKEEPGKVESQIADVQAEVKALIGKEPIFFRPPYGSGGDTVKAAAKNHGMLFMTWSNGSLDWEQKAPGDPDKVIGNVLEQLHPGANILMHELKWTAAALDGLLTKLGEKGYSFIDPETIKVSP